MSESIETKIEEIITQLEQHKETHPVFVKVWSLYLREKFNNLKIMMTKCEQMANSDLTTTPDLDPQLLASLVTMF
jgi:hypothetical protein